MAIAASAVQAIELSKPCGGGPGALLTGDAVGFAISGGADPVQGD